MPTSALEEMDVHQQQLVIQLLDLAQQAVQRGGDSEQAVRKAMRRFW